MRLLVLVACAIVAATTVRVHAQTVRGLSASGDAYQLAIVHNSDGSVSVVRQAVAPDPNDYVYIALYDGALASYTPDGVVISGADLNGRPYWFVPFDPTETPFRTEWKTWWCPCEKTQAVSEPTGKCRVRTSDFVNFDCASDQCTGSCVLKSNGRAVGGGGGVVVSATSIDVNGIVFQ